MENSLEKKIKKIIDQQPWGEKNYYFFLFG